MREGRGLRGNGGGKGRGLRGNGGVKGRGIGGGRGGGEGKWGERREVL